jgi:hypothetical protein
LLEQSGWPRVFLPSYVCSELTEAAGERVCFYADDPLREQIEPPDDLQAGDAIVRIDYFGLRGPSSAADLRARGVIVIDDHTHDPCSDWARSSDADYCLASLRKSLPLPDGALLWSPQGHTLPEPPATCEDAAAKLPAMLLKSLYLRGHAIDKPAFRQLAIAGEAKLAELGVVGMSTVARELLRCLPISRLRAARRENFAAFAEHVSTSVDLLRGHPDRTPFACVLILPDQAARDRLRGALIDARIYPAVLWPLDEFGESHRSLFPRACELSERMLALHCDGRYGIADMLRVAAHARVP